MALSAVSNIKAELRRQLRSQRQALTAQRRAHLDALICGQVLQTLMATEKPNQAIALFIAHGGEPDLMPVIHGLIESGRAVYLPVLAGESLTFHRFDPSQAMIPNRFGIPEPSDQPAIDVHALDWVMMPLVGFSSAGGRLGMGGGFYDRTLAGLKDNGPIKAGLAYAFQQLDSLPTEPWDVMLDVVISDRGALWVK